MRITAKVDYAVRAVVELARAQPADGSRPTPVKGHHLSESQDIPVKFLERILSELKHAGIVGSARGSDGGYWLAKPAGEVSVAEVIRSVEGPLADVRGVRPDALDYPDDLAALQRMWIGLRANIRAVLDTTSVADLAAGELAPEVAALADDPAAWHDA